MSRRFRLVIILLALILAAVAVPLLASADEGGVTVSEATAESQFPDGIVFRVAAESPGIIDDVRVFFKKADQSGRSAYRSIEVEPGESVAGETLLPASGGGDYFPPGTKITYHFEVWDKAGEVTRTEETEFVYLDNRFEWLTLTDDLITVYYYSEYVEERARIILEAARQTMDNMVPVLGIAPTEPLRIVTYNNYRHMSMALPFRSQAVREELQAQGMAFSDERVLLIHGYDPTVTGTTSHEFVHLLVAEAAGGTAAAVPAWLNEGLAEYGNIDKTDDYDAALRYGIYTRRIRPLWYLQSFTGEPEDILIAYGHGKSVVSYMIARWGEHRIPELFNAIRQSQDIDTALLRVYGLDQHGMDTEWRLAMGLEPLPSPEELASRIRESEESAGTEGKGAGEEATPEPDTSQAESTATEEATKEPQPAPAESQPALSTVTPTEEPEDGATAGACSAPPGGSASISLGALALMAGPLGLGALPFLRNRRKGGGRTTGPAD
ncbi:MAG: hypothetical protein F4X66_19730 [Chloroflexi bacterium]|nr:hypothetical protein [Chloroflexota bacterium]